MSVFECKRSGSWDYQIVPPTRFKHRIDEPLRSKIAHAYAEHAGGIAYDGDIACIEGISAEGPRSERTVYLSVAGFFDFICANIVGREAAESSRIERVMRAAGSGDDVLAAVQKLGVQYKQAKASAIDFDSAISSALLPNAIAVSILVHDELGNYILSRRTDNVIISKGFYGVTASGSVEPGDLAAMPGKGEIGGLDPFCACAARELAEETGLGIPDRNFKLRGLVIGHEKLQPIAIVDALSPTPFADGWREYDPSDDDPDAEVSKLVSVPKDRLAMMPGRYEMTEAAAYHMLLHVEG